MQNITIGRYKPNAPLLAGTAGIEVAIDVSSVFDGWIEGVRDDGSTWIMWLDALGNPTVYYGQRDETGAVVGDPVVLDPGSPLLDGTDQPS